MAIERLITVIAAIATCFAIQYYILAGTGAVNTVTVNGQRTAFSANATYNSSLITVQRNGMPSCTHFAPYVDLHTGELMAEVQFLSH